MFYMDESSVTWWSQRKRLRIIHNVLVTAIFGYFLKLVNPVTLNNPYSLCQTSDRSYPVPTMTGGYYLRQNKKKIKSLCLCPISYLFAYLKGWIQITMAKKCSKNAFSLLEDSKYQEKMFWDVLFETILSKRLLR